MKPLILLTGKTGQVGSALARLLPQAGDVVALNRRELDLSQPDAIRRTVKEIRPQVIVNTAAYTAVDKAETDEAAAHAVNAAAPGVLAEEAKKIGAVLAHFSTDYVFDGSKKTPYGESDVPNPLNVYGKTKLAGEAAIRATGTAHLIFRTSWVYSTQGKNFLLTMLRLATEREELRVVSDQVGAPTCAEEIAAATTRILSGLYKPEGGSTLSREKSGTYHMTAAGTASWCDFARAILEKARALTQQPLWLRQVTQGRPFVAHHVVPITTAEFPTAARRPANSLLSNDRLKDTFGIQLADWQSQLQSCFESGGL